MSNETILLPCPFCGGEAQVIKDGLPYVVIECEHCFCRTNCNVTEAEAIAVWNTRAEMGNGTCEWQLEHSGTLYDKWRCSKCGYLFVESRTDQGIKEDFEPNFCPNCGAKVVG